MVVRECFENEASRALLCANGLRTFDDIWSRESGALIDHPNTCGNGWSRVDRWQLIGPQGNQVNVYVKRQENYFSITALHPLRGIPTLAREYRNVHLLRERKIPCVVPLFFGARRAAHIWQTVLVTHSLDEHYLSLDAWVAAHPLTPETAALRDEVTSSVAQAIARLHSYRLLHRALYGKHIYVRRKPSSFRYQADDVCFIDLEKLRRTLWGYQFRRIDLDQIQRRVEGWTARDQELFMDSYRLARRRKHTHGSSAQAGLER